MISYTYILLSGFNLLNSKYKSQKMKESLFQVKMYISLTRQSDSDEWIST